MSELFEEQLKSLVVSFLLTQSPVSMRTNSPAVTKKSVPSTPNRSSRSQLFGPSSPPPPVRTYGRRSRNRSQPSTPSQICTTSSSSTPSRRNAPASSTSTAPSLHLPSLALDYEEPVLLPATPPHSLNSAASFSGSSGAIAHNVVDALVLESNEEDDVVFVSMKSSQSQSSQDIGLSDESHQNDADLANALKVAKKNIQSFNDAAKPGIILPAPIAARFKAVSTPIPNYSCQRSVDDMLEMKGIPTPLREPLQWPRAFQSRPPSLPFVSRTGTYPVSPPVFAPAPFPIFVDDD
ncbi:hypothetical protein F5877DRAFT_84718 [Lentinula edodes]|nr:hypothetical protein F5877DRAFT_84718 [Lentinula edodes]